MSDSENTHNDAPLLSPSEASKLIESGVILIDVRAETTRIDVGAIPDSVTVSKTAVLEQLEKYAADSGLSEAELHEKQIVVYCSSERGSGPVTEVLVDSGFANVAHIDGGFTAWREAGLPVQSAVTD